MSEHRADPVTQPKKEHHTGPVPHGFSTARQYQEIQLPSMFISIHVGNNCIRIYDDIVCVKNILDYQGDIIFVFKKFKTVNNMFQYPCDSKFVGINVVSTLSSDLFSAPITSIKNKYVYFH